MALLRRDRRGQHVVLRSAQVLKQDGVNLFHLQPLPRLEAQALLGRCLACLCQGLPNGQVIGGSATWSYASMIWRQLRPSNGTCPVTMNCVKRPHEKTSKLDSASAAPPGP